MKLIDFPPVTHLKQESIQLPASSPFSYEMEYLRDFPKFSLGWDKISEPLMETIELESNTCWIDFSFCSSGLNSLCFLDYYCSKDEILQSDCYTANAVSSSVLSTVYFYNRILSYTSSIFRKH